MKETKTLPKVRMSKPGERKVAQGRKIELRYNDPHTGKEIRISTGTLDESEATEQKKVLEAKLLVGIDPKPGRRSGSPQMLWSDFRERYRELHVSTLRESTIAATESRLDIAERIAKPKTLSDMASSDLLHELQKKLLDGAESTVGPKGHKSDRGPRSPHTVKSYMTVVLGALSWAALMGWIPAAPKLKKVRVSKLRQMKGRAITGEEFDRILAKVKDEVGADAEDSWKYLLRGLWESGLRLEELMNVHWSDYQYIVPTWKRGALSFLSIPAEMQKNDVEESIPLLPGFEALLNETQEAQRFGWVFNPVSLQLKLGRRARHQRPDAEWVGKIISRIGKVAGVIVLPAKGTKKAKFASAHDLRRSCAERLVSAGVPEREVARVLRHASVETTRKHYAPGNVQESAGIIRDRLTVPRNSQAAKST